MQFDILVEKFSKKKNFFCWIFLFFNWDKKQCCHWKIDKKTCKNYFFKTEKKKNFFFRILVSLLHLLSFFIWENSVPNPCSVDRICKTLNNWKRIFETVKIKIPKKKFFFSDFMWSQINKKFEKKLEIAEKKTKKKKNHHFSKIKKFSPFKIPLNLNKFGFQQYLIWVSFLKKFQFSIYLFRFKIIRNHWTFCTFDLFDFLRLIKKTFYEDSDFAIPFFPIS